ncbi:MAG: CDP-alcohol phosphatidyltransferase family protein [Candidatus Omnitrophica bacterium]|nr:CDP-alcohol phosphatidyltransferase family protein [Candidatus Omnitrophota bacterium]MBU0878785.1 CDP-alcohol phosphatidyltransferase family protein [Candidatus Omnitrophota bacterium]MBU0896935.1 CDP-alcohol phosphatidyltransferase family protein [Candidatus Omnitrophota bacterium]MBU1133582.1 CDP-alcohol phosphatidyltransferase family protein [Candidatus Omnitrophota bacterium]MBU1810410.1 CDP-alcohol phosphatidyltransferase family protein [Candidatus Omnitrophota bacterium]
MNLADKISTLRILLIPVFVSLLCYFNHQHLHLRYVVIGVFAFAILTDFFDGLVARIKKEKSEIGKIIDPLADKFLLLTAFISLYALRLPLPLKFKLPLEVVLVVVSRDFIILLGVIILHFLKIEIFISPSVWGKLTTFFQMFTILGILVDFSFVPLIWTIAIIFTLISGIDYFVRGIKAINGRVSSPNF